MAQDFFSMDVRYYGWTPESDITAHELALALPALLSGSLASYDSLPESLLQRLGACLGADEGVVPEEYLKLDCKSEDVELF